MIRLRALYSPPPKSQLVKKTIGFIILRHVNDALTNQYWIYCYTCIRKFYAENEIIIIDDNSNPAFISAIPLYKTTVISSEYPQRGELLPYYYFLRNKLFDIAVIIHDSVFIQKYMDFNVNTYKLHGFTRNNLYRQTYRYKFNTNDRHLVLVYVWPNAQWTTFVRI